MNTTPTAEDLALDLAYCLSHLGNPWPPSFVRAAAKRALAAEAELARLQDAIRAHRDQRGDDRCWLDDLTLYATLPEGAPTPADLCLHDPATMLRNCQAFIASRQPGGLPYVSPQREIERLEAEVARLQALCQGLADRAAAQSDLLSRRAEKGGDSC